MNSYVLFNKKLQVNYRIKYKKQNLADSKYKGDFIYQAANAKTLTEKIDIFEYIKIKNLCIMNGITKSNNRFEKVFNSDEKGYFYILECAAVQELFYTTLYIHIYIT